jgi:hypothetical protein
MATPTLPVSKLDFQQIIQNVHNEVDQCLRVDAKVSIGETEVIISHENDSIRLGDGTDLVTTTTIGSDVGLDVNVINPITATVDLNQPSAPTIVNTNAPVSGTEYSFVLPVDTGQFQMRSRSRGQIQFAYTAAASGTNYITLRPGSIYTSDNLDLTGALTVYFQSTKNNDVLEIEYWID